MERNQFTRRPCSIGQLTELVPTRTIHSMLYILCISNLFYTLICPEAYRLY